MSGGKWSKPPGPPKLCEHDSGYSGVFVCLLCGISRPPEAYPKSRAPTEDPPEPVRTNRDGAVGACHVEGDLFGFSVNHNGEEQSVTCSEFNARRLLGAMSVVLGLPLSREAQKKVKM